MLVELAFQGRDEWLSSTRLAEMIGADLPFLQDVLNRLSGAGLSYSKLGRQGGLQLAVLVVCHRASTDHLGRLREITSETLSVGSG